MNKILTLVLFGFSLQSFGQVTDDFSDGDFTNNPVWTSDILANWIVVNGQLRSNSATASSSFFISTPSAKALNAQWEFLVNLQFNTSGANFVDVFLLSEQANPATAGNNGYFVRIGGTLDEVSLFKMSAGVATNIINGIDGITNTSNSTLRIKVIRDANNQWTLERDISGTGNNYVSEGTVVDNTIVTSSFFGIRITQSTATFHLKHFFDDIYVGNIIVESTPPTLQSITVNSSTELLVNFSEPLEISTAENITHYSVNNTIGNPATAVLQPDQKSVKLTFAKAFTNGVENQLSISGVADLVGNAIVPVTTNFLYFVPQPAAFNDIIINELFPDPSPQIGLPAAEFVEIYNRSTKPFDLLNWKLSDPSSTATLPSFILLPNEYVIITNSGAITSFTPFGKVIGLANFPTLNNASDAIKLTDAAGLKIDSVNYELSWYQDADKEQGGWTLERLNPEVNTNEPTNWQASINVSGGTPGKQNSVFGKNPDSTPPQWLTLQVTSQEQLTLTFNEALSISVLTAQFVVNNDVGSPISTELSSDQKIVKLNFATKFQNGINHILQVSGIEDAAGNMMPLAEKSFRYLLTQPEKNKDVIITEIMADPSPIVQLPEAEYIEVYNRTEGPFDLGGWKLSDATGEATLSSHILLPNEYLIVTSTTNASKFVNYGSVLGVSSFPSLNNVGEAIVLRNANNLLIDSVNYTTNWYRDLEKQDGGWSLELIDPQNICGEEDNWMASESDKGGSPGKVNSVNANKADVTGPRLLAVIPVSSNQLKLSFQEKLNTSLTGVEILISPTAAISSLAFVDYTLRELLVTLQTSLEIRALYTIQIKGLRDCAGNLIAENFDQLEFALTEEPAPLDIVINELLFNPRSGGVDFVELYNASDKFFNLKNWQVGNSENGALQNARPITTTDFILRPKAYITLTSDPAILAAQYPIGNATTFFQTTLPSFPDDEGSVAIRAGAIVIDAFVYSNNFHSPLLKDDEGVSLERISFTQPTQDSFQWKSATASAGFATPGLFNSNARADNTDLTSAVVVDPEVFSPDQGFAKIQYSFDQSSLVANVKILDHQGRLIKEVANNETIGYEGFFRWDGDTQDGTKTRMGYYTVWMEVYGLDGTVKTFRKRVVVSR